MLSDPLEEFLTRVGCKQLAPALAGEGISYQNIIGKLDDTTLREKVADARVPTLSVHALAVYFKLNNSALYADPTPADPTTKFFRDLGNDRVRTFLEFVASKSTVPVSLSLTRKNLETESLMLVRAHAATERIELGISQAEWLHAMMLDIKKNKHDLNANKDRVLM